MSVFLNFALVVNRAVIRGVRASLPDFPIGIGEIGKCMSNEPSLSLNRSLVRHRCIVFNYFTSLFFRSGTKKRWLELCFRNGSAIKAF